MVRTYPKIFLLSGAVTAAVRVLAGPFFECSTILLKFDIIGWFMNFFTSR